jgi:MFS family permease
MRGAAAAGAKPKMGAFHALRSPNFRLFFWGQMVSVAGSWMQTVAQQWLVYDLTHSAAWLGVVTGASALPYVALTLYGGKVADRLPRRNILLWTQAASLVLALILAALATNWFVPIRPWHIVVLSALLGVVHAFNMPAQQAFVTDLVEGREALGNAIALNSLQFNLARVLGPVAAGWVLLKAGAAGCFALNALSFIAVIVSLSLLRIDPMRGQNPNSDGGSVWEGFRYIRQAPAVLRVVLLIGVASLLLWSVSTLYPVFAARFGQGAKGFSQMVTANGVGAALGGILVATFGERLPRRHLVYGGAAAFCVALLLVTSAPTYVLLLASLVLAGLCMMMLGINANTRVQQEVPDRLRGRVMAVYSLVFGGLMPLGGLEVGFLAERLGPVTAVRINATIALVIVIGIFAWSHLERRRPALTNR